MRFEWKNPKCGQGQCGRTKTKHDTQVSIHTLLVNKNPVDESVYLSGLTPISDYFIAPISPNVVRVSSQSRVLNSGAFDTQVPVETEACSQPPDSPDSAPLRSLHERFRHGSSVPVGE